MSNEPKHTAGPWEVTGNGMHVRTASPVRDQICTVNSNGNADQDKANARLMAAAPDMLIVLKEAVEHAHVYDTNPALVELFEAVIRKATQE